ncbi:hypothetical protein MHI12_07670 [Paenibacillus sp. FSL H8-0280]|uniref:hypothetical protein n=1 Tax=Paenibacillus sp. FSL H8-0280 TaxID=2921382 RepID=UPI003255CEBD
MHTKDLNLDQLLEHAFALRNQAGIKYTSFENLIKASEIFNEALKRYDQIYNTYKDIPIHNDLIKINREHIRYEKYNCLFIYYHRIHKYEKSLANFQLANNHINNTLHYINLLEPSIKDNIREDFLYDKNRWTYYSLQLSSQYYFVMGDFEKCKNNLTASLDNYKKSINEQLVLLETVKIYLPYLEPHYERLVLANYEMVISNYAIVKSISLGSIDKSSKLYGTILIETVTELWNAYVHTINSIYIFPEIEQNIVVAENQLTKINNLLSKNKNLWPQFIAKMKQDDAFIENLKSIDMKNYKRALNNGGHIQMKKYIISGIFTLISISIIFALLATVSNLLTPLQFFLMSGVGIVLIVITSAIQLKISGQIKEENFMKLIQISLDKYFKDLKSIIKYFKK